MQCDQAKAGQSGAFWSEAGGKTWAEVQDLMDRLNRPVGQAVEEQAFPGPGGRVLDVGCGGGATTLDMARRLGPEGLCVGIDISPELIELARRRAVAEGVAQARFVQGDAQEHSFEQEYDAVVSRFGVMFFSDPVLAFANLYRALRPGGELAFACWRSPLDNPLSLEPLEAALPHIPGATRPDLEGPGRFAFAERDRVHGVLQVSGWRGIEIAPLDVPTPVSFDELMILSLRLGFLGPLLKDQPQDVQSQVREAVADRLRAYVRDGVIEMNAACWLVTARR